MTRRVLNVGVLLVCLFLGEIRLPAVQILPLPIETLSSNAVLIVQGTVLSKTVQRDAVGRIYTAVLINVEEAWKGPVGTNHLTIVHGGGVLGDEAAEVSGEAEYEIGEEIVSFLVLNDRGAAVSLGLAQGKFHVWPDSHTGEKLAHNAVHGLRPDSQERPTGAVERNRIVSRLSLKELKRRAKGPDR